MNYSELLQSPKWQKKRLEVLERAGWKCEICMKEDEMLMIHHKKYLKGNVPWDYPDNYLMCVCKEHHDLLHDKKDSKRDDDDSMVIMMNLRSNFKEKWWIFLDYIEEHSNKALARILYLYDSPFKIVVYTEKNKGVFVISNNKVHNFFAEDVIDGMMGDFKKCSNNFFKLECEIEYGKEEPYS